jgi:hypothetical protein
MRLVKSVLCALALSALAASPSAAQTGPDYVFNVPVNFDNVPSLNGHSFTVACMVRVVGSDGRTSAYRSTDGLPSHPTHAIGPTGFHETIRVEVRLPAGVRRADATGWSCDASFSTVTNTTGARVLMTNASQYTALTGQAVTRSQLLVQASFPR